ncbi:MAG: thiol protease/hemagglutinin PrtT [Bacteroidota bacterium]
MKKFLLVLLSFALIVNISAAPVNPEQAIKIAKNFYLQMNKDKEFPNISLTLVYTISSKNVYTTKGLNEEETPILYIFNVNQNDGFVIISADNSATPILGYALTGNYSSENRPIAFIKLLEKYKQEIIFIISNKLIADKDIKTKWENLENGKPNEQKKSTSSVNPLCNTTWNQSPYYNDLCPYNTQYSNRTVTGCVATAMAQIMKYWNYPTTGSGFHSYNSQVYGTLSANFGATTYNWASMPNNVSSANNSVATLMSHCGISVNMNYGVAATGGSSAFVIDDNGANPECAQNSYKTYFGYNPSTIQGLKRVNYSDANWKQLLKTDLDASHPIQYAGFGTNGGHTFVCDGYNSSDMFHMNWGWGGQSDGYFTLDALNPGSLGTGGGAGGFNSGQQAVIGIQPPSGAITSVIGMYSSITVTPNPISFGQSFTVNADVKNNGTSNFSGDFCAALFTSSGAFVNYIQTLSASTSPLQPGYHYTGGLAFSNTGLITVPGNYFIGIYFRDPGGNWHLAGNASYSNAINITINSPVDYIQQYSTIVASPATFIQGQAATVNVNIKNDKSSTYYGVYRAALFDLNGNFVQTIGTYNETTGLPAGYIYSSPYITFSTTAITATPGTYILAIQELENGYSNWYLIGGQYYSTPININVVAPIIIPDIYEPNNSESTAYNLSLNFSGNTTVINTIGSNIHNGNDLDYYKLNLPSGYNYSITARVHDSYNSGNGQTYTADVLFSYKIGTQISDTYDDVMPNNIQINNGGMIIFGVAPYMSGETGTYLLDISITRTLNVGIIENDYSNTIIVYPNPAKNIINIDLSNISTKVTTIKVYDNTGKEICNFKLSDFNENIYQIPISNFSNGLYYMSIISSNKFYSKKFTIQK